ncbi:hypothetical protein HDU88_002519 [Geranomyces variabilis]|nr:hypothetical protein HDU88_002519 [Geranomyces variabilis]
MSNVQHSRKQDRTSQQDKLQKIIHDERLTTKGIASQLFPERKRAATPEADERRNKRPHASKEPTVVSAEEAEDVDTLVAFEPEFELPVEEGNSAKSRTSNSGSSRDERLLSLAILRERFGDIQQFKSTKDARKPAVAKLWDKATATFAEERISLRLKARRQRVVGEFDQAFIETKSSQHADSASATVYDLFTLGHFCQGAVNYKTKQHVKNSPSYAFHFLRESIEIYHMELEYDGIYTMVNIASCRIPRRLDDLWLLPPLIAAMLHVKAGLGSAKFAASRDLTFPAVYIGDIHPRNLESRR